jgi:hypothetical protein
LRGGSAFGREQPSAHQLKPGRTQIRHDERPAEALRQPLHEVRLLSGSDFDRMAHIDRKHAVRR